MTRDRASLQRWYRQAMGGRADELREVRERLLAGVPEGLEEARRIGMALRGSGATFGFPRITDVASLVETAPDEDVLRRVEGLIGELDRAHDGADDGAGDGRDTDVRPGWPEWLLRSVGVEASSAPKSPPDGGWTELARRAGMDLTRMTRKAGDYLGLEVADLRAGRPTALRLVPEAFVASARVLPLREDSETITVASSDPTSLITELELERLTGRRPVFVVAPPEALSAVLADVLGRASASPAPATGPARVTASESGDVSTDETRVRADPEEGPTRGHPAPPPDEDAVLEHRAVLVVDDDPAARLMIRTLLERQRYEVVEAADGIEALEIARQHRPIGLVVADLNMPRMDGLELIWALRGAEPTRRLPVIVVTGEPDEILETQLLEEGADDYIRKPLDPRLFLARVESTLRRLDASPEQGAEAPRSG